MPEITRKRIGEIVRKVFEVLLSHPEGMRAKDLLAQVEQSMTLSEFEKSDYPNRPGVRRFEKTARFATIAPVRKPGKTRLSPAFPGFPSVPGFPAFKVRQTKRNSNGPSSNNTHSLLQRTDTRPYGAFLPPRRVQVQLSGGLLEN